MFFSPFRATPLDIRFSLFGIPVTVSPFFWLFTALLGFPVIEQEPGGPANLIAWTLCVFLSILVHEFGHAVVLWGFGHRPEIYLQQFGGFATFSHRETPGKALVVFLAGPAVQLVLFAGVLALYFWLGETARLPEFGTPLRVMLTSALEINLLWPIINLLPAIPLDGGRALQAFLELLEIRSATTWALRVGTAVGTIAAIGFFALNSFFAGLLFAFIAVQNYQMLKAQQSGPP